MKKEKVAKKVKAEKLQEVFRRSFKREISLASKTLAYSTDAS